MTARSHTKAKHREKRRSHDHKRRFKARNWAQPRKDKHAVDEMDQAIWKLMHGIGGWKES